MKQFTQLMKKKGRLLGIVPQKLKTQVTIYYKEEK